MTEHSYNYTIQVIALYTTYSTISTNLNLRTYAAVMSTGGSSASSLHSSFLHSCQLKLPASRAPHHLMEVAHVKIQNSLRLPSMIRTDMRRISFLLSTPNSPMRSSADLWHQIPLLVMMRSQCLTSTTPGFDLRAASMPGLSKYFRIFASRAAIMSTLLPIMCASMTKARRPMEATRSGF